VAGPVRTDSRTLRWTYDGRDRCQRGTDIVFDPAPAHVADEEAQFIVELAPGAERQISLAITPWEGQLHRTASLPRSAHEENRHAQKAERLWLGGAAEVQSSNEFFNRVMRRALLDLRVLRSRLDRRHYFAAGVPWFVTLFGRDSAIAAVQTLPYGPTMARDTLLLLARYQSDGYDAFRDAEPGKILHELRRGELAHLNEIPQSPAYYGTVDATMWFLVLAAEYLAWSGDIQTIRRLRSHIDGAIGWMERDGDHDGDGFFDYVGEYSNGLVNQGWKDSGNAIVNADGSLAQPPIATAEVQSYAFRAWRQTAWLLRALGEHDRAAALDSEADALRGRFERAFLLLELCC
jgi:glycogen debranching enzyme